MTALFEQQDHLSPEDLSRGGRALIQSAAFSQVFGALTGGAFLAAFALALGATNLVIGVMAAVGPPSQILQIPTIYLVERIGGRKALVFIPEILGRLFWVVIALAPLLFPRPWQIPIFLTCLILYFSLGAISDCAFNSWMRDAIPEKHMGRFTARSMVVATSVGGVITLAAGFGLEQLRALWPSATGPYSILFLVGATSGLLGVLPILRVPEPRSLRSGAEGLFALLREPLREANFRSVLIFSASWNFAISMAGAFYAVYLIRSLGLSMSFIVSLGVGSKIANVACLKAWGRMADRAGSRRTLSMAGPPFILCIFLLPFTTLPDKHVMTIPLLVMIYLLSGISTAGVTVSAGNPALKAAPRGRATAYLAVNSLISGLAAACAPVLGGWMADVFARREFSVLIDFSGGRESFSLLALSLRELDFVFFLSGFVGIYALHRLTLIREQTGDIADEHRPGTLNREVPRTYSDVPAVAGVSQMGDFPYARLQQPEDAPPADRQRPAPITPASSDSGPRSS